MFSKKKYNVLIFSEIKISFWENIFQNEIYSKLVNAIKNNNYTIISQKDAQ